MNDPTPLQARLSVRGQLRQVVPLASGLGIWTVLLVVGTVPRWLAVAAVIVLGALALVGLVNALRSPQAGVVLRLDDQGVTRKGSPTVRWADLGAVRIVSLLPWWQGGSGGQVVAFVPRPGVELPGPPTASGRDQEFGHRTRVRRYGSNLVVLAGNLTIGPDELAEYAHRVGGLPVQVASGRVVRRRVWVFVLIIGIVSLVTGLAAGLR